MWDFKEGSTVVTMSPSHARPVNCIAVHVDRGLMMTGSEDSTARLVNTSTGKVMFHHNMHSTVDTSFFHIEQRTSH